jgi:hypothetical protein
MSTLTSLARIEAADMGRAQLIRTVRHVHVSDRPMVIVPMQLAGEPCAPLAAMIGDDRSAPRLLIVANPLNRDDRFRFAADLAGIALAYVGAYAAGPEPGEKEAYPDAPQLVVPNAGGVKFAELLGRSTRFRPTAGQGAVPAIVPAFGRWLTYFAERAQHPASSLLLTATGALSAHWATGQSAAEDQNLAALLAWISPPPGMTGRQAALLAEDPVQSPPAGPATDPVFDRDVLAGLYKAIKESRAAGDGAAQRGWGAGPEEALARLERELWLALEPTWQLVWRSIDLLGSLAAGGHVAERWKSDRRSFSGYVRYLREGGFPQAKRDAAVDAARRLARLESEQEQLDAQMAFDDPLVIAEHLMTGQAFEGVVVHAEPGRRDESGKRAKLRPRIVLETTDEVTSDPGAGLRSPARPGQKAVVIEVAKLDGRTRVTLELQNGMGRGLVPAPGSVPEADDVLCYTTLTLDFQPPPEFPAREDTPWTHGGPPPEYVPADQDATEPWGAEPWGAEPWDGVAWENTAWENTAWENTAWENTVREDEVR